MEQTKKSEQNIQKFSKHMLEFPNEIFLYIFSYLHIKTLMKCRLVSRRWKDIIDKITKNQNLWKLHCKTDFNEVYIEAREKSPIDTNWSDIYKSLSLWDQVGSTKEIYEEFAIASDASQEIIDISVHSNCKVDIQRRRDFVYYNGNTLVPLNYYQGNTGNIVRYARNSRCAVYLDLDYRLLVKRTTKKDEIAFENITGFILFDKHVYFHKYHTGLYSCDLSENVLKSKLLHCWDLEYILFLGYTNKLYIFTTATQIYSFDKKVELVCKLQEKPLITLLKYNLLKNQSFEDLMLLLPLFSESLRFGSDPLPFPPPQHVTCVHLYRGYLFFGTANGIVCMYNANTFENVKVSTPIKMWNFSKPNYFPLTIPMIVKIEVVEAKHGHTLFIVTHKKIIVIKLYHDFLWDKNNAMLPYQKHKFLLNVYKKQPDELH